MKAHAKLWNAALHPTDPMFWVTADATSPEEFGEMNSEVNFSAHKNGTSLSADENRMFALFYALAFANFPNVKTIEV